MTRERWGASKFVRNQRRSITDNAIASDADPTTIPNDLPRDFSRHAIIPASQFYDIVEPAFGEGKNKMSLTNVKALYKRGHFIVNTKEATYLKVAGEDNVKVFLDGTEKRWFGS